MKKNNFKEYINEIKHFNLQDLKLDNIAEWPTLIRWSSPFLLFFFFVFVFNFFYVDNVNKEISDFKKQEYSQIRKIDSNSQKMANYKKMKEQIEEINEHFNTVRAEFPKSLNMNKLTEKLLSGHNIENLNINKVNINQKINNDYYSETPIKILANGNYHSFGKFITHLANSDEMFSIESIIIEPTDDNNSLNFDLTLKTYESNNILTKNEKVKVRKLKTNTNKDI
jgi:type IV pilus assembly protein PilO